MLSRARAAKTSDRAAARNPGRTSIPERDPDADPDPGTSGPLPRPALPHPIRLAGAEAGRLAPLRLPRLRSDCLPRTGPRPARHPQPPLVLPGPRARAAAEAAARHRAARAGRRAGTG